MQTRENFLNYINEACQIIQPLSIPDSDLLKQKEQIESAELIVPVVGGFSAGKSTLINSFLGNDILPTAVTPETALATELRYSNENYIEAVSSNGSIERHAIEEFAALKDNARNFKNLRVYLNNAALQAIQPLVLVDMPGFDAPIENHNQAILSYLERGVYFVFLTSVEDGNITVSMKREIENLQRIGKGFSFCISKTNLRSASDVAAVRQKIAEQLEDYFDYTGDIALLDDNGGSNLKNILAAVNPEKLFESLFSDGLKNNYAALTQSINLKISTLKGTKQEAEDTIAALQEAINSIMQRKDAAVAEAERRYSGNSINQISQEVEAAIIQSRNHLVELALSNQAAFERELNDLAKNSLLSATQKRFQTIGNEVTQDLTSALSGQISLMPVGGISDAVMATLSKSNPVVSTVNVAITKVGQAVAKQIGSTTLKALVGGVFGIVGAIVMFLPEIISFFNKGQKEREQRQHVESQLLNVIIPQIKGKIGDTLPPMMTEHITAMINQISEQFEQQLAQKRQEIEQAEAEKQQRADELESIIAELEAGNKALAEAANRYLMV